jgi:hypothetical protein
MASSVKFCLQFTKINVCSSIPLSLFILSSCTHFSQYFTKIIASVSSAANSKILQRHQKLTS